MAKTPESIRESLKAVSEANEGVEFGSRGLKGALIGKMDEACRGQRHAVLEYLFGKSTSKDLSDGEWFAISRWIDTQQIGEEWIPQENLQEEIDAILVEINAPVEITVKKLPKEVYRFD